MSQPLDAQALDTLFREARTLYAWLAKDIPDQLLHQLYDLLRLGPTASNACPARFLFVKSAQAKARLKPSLSPGNVEKTMTAPITVIVAQDLEFYEKLPELFPHVDARSWFVGNEQLIRDTAFRSSSLQGAYLILAARSLGLDCGPMSGFDQAMVDAEFFPDGKVKSNFLVNLGYGDRSRLHPRSPRLAFEEACQIL